MQEFSSVTASSYDADALAPLLTQKSADGWSVVAIVTAGTSIVAYLERESGSGGTDEAVTSAGEATDVVVADVPSEEPTADTAPYVPVAAASAEPADSSGVDEPAGWAVAPDSTSDDTTSTSDESLSELVADVEAAETADATAGVPVAAEAVAEPAASEPVAAEPETPEPAAPTQPESTVPAGWYADPSGRYELRYWDGTAWTEHVSRAGQQFTDPPVA